MKQLLVAPNKRSVRTRDLANMSASNPGRVGPPKSSNGASSMHLFWQLPANDPGDPLVEASVLVKIDTPPVTNDLFFWALQVSFIEQEKVMGAGHLGLQHHPSYPTGGALNWGGYHGAGSTGSGELPGSPLELISELNNPNTGNYPWVAGQTYLYRITKLRSSGVEDRLGWKGSIVDIKSGVETVIRNLWCPGSELGNIMVWTEAFADCDAPGVIAHWSDFTATSASGISVHPTAVRVNYQSPADGGCITTDTGFSADGVIAQYTGAERTTAQGSILRL